MIEDASTMALEADVIINKDFGDLTIIGFNMEYAFSKPNIRQNRIDGFLFIDEAILKNSIGSSRAGFVRNRSIYP